MEGRGTNPPLAGEPSHHIRAGREGTCGGPCALGASEGAMTEQSNATSVAFIVNPASGRGTGKTFGESLIARGHTVHWTTSPGDGVRAARESTATRLIAVGGDGTLGEVVNGAREREIGLIPCGTGNDFARHVGIPLDPEQALSMALQTPTKSTDVISLGDRLCLNVVACGFDAEVGEKVNRGYRWAKGTLAYVTALVQSLGSYRPTALTLTVDGEVHHLKAAICAIGNGSQYGGGMRIAPNALVDDGLLDVVVIGELGRLDLIRQFPTLFKGTHVQHPEVKVFRGRSAHVEAERPLPVLSDGDLFGRTPFAAEILPGALAFVRP